MYTTPSQPGTTTPSIPSSLQSITFILAGRTTLSEHCPTEHIEVDYAIAKRSPYLRIYLPQHIRDDRPLLPIQLGDIDPAGFKLYIEWLTTNTITLSTRRSLRLDSCIDLIYAHIVGSAFSQPHFQDYIIDTLAYVLDPAQSFDQKILEMLFLEKHAGTVLRTFVTDRMFAYERRMLGMIRNAVEDVVTGSGEVKGCEYHVHEEGVCYKHGRVGGSEERERYGDGGARKWSIDDDPELNAMAAQYLGKNKVASTVQEKSSTDKRKTRKCRQPSFAPQRNKLPPSAIHIKTPQNQKPTPKPREMHSPHPSIRSPAPSIHTDKPLPPTPTPEPVHPPSTQDLVLECLGRLSPTPIPAAGRTSTKDLIDECLARSIMPTEYTASPPPSPPATSSIASLDTDTDTEEKEKGEGDIPPSLFPGSPAYTHPTRNLSFTPLPKSTAKTISPIFPASSSSSPPSPSPSSPPLQRPYHIFPSSPSVPHFPPLIKRKPAPPRGVDWLEQWDRLFALQGTQGFGLRRGERRERRSWFTEILGGG